MSFSIDQFRDVVETTLNYMGPKYNTEEAVDLLLLTAAQESHMGTYLQQLGAGPAKGVYQMEPDTLEDLYNNYLMYKPRHQQVLEKFTVKFLNLEFQLTTNIAYQTAAARLQYFRKPFNLPKKSSFKDEYDYVVALAKIWKQYWNTPKGKGTVEEAVANWGRFVKNI